MKLKLKFKINIINNIKWWYWIINIIKNIKEELKELN